MEVQTESRDFDVAVYALECDYLDPRPQIDSKYIATGTNLEDRSPFSGVSPKRVKPARGNGTGMSRKVITNETGSVSYPLYQEYAAEAEKVYYVGETSQRRPEKRINEHLRTVDDQSESEETKFLNDVNELKLIKKEYYSVDIDRSQILQEAREELDHPESNDEYNKLEHKLRENKRVDYSDIYYWKIRCGISFEILDEYEDQAKSFKQKERDLGVELTEITGSDTGKIRPKDVKSYAYWM